MTLPHGCLEILWSQSITMVQLLSFVKQVLTMMVPYMLCNSQTYIKRVYLEAEGLRLKYKDIFISYDEDPRVVRIIIGNFIPLK